MPRPGFLVAEKLLAKAAENIEEAARSVVEEASSAPELVTPLDRDGWDHRRQPQDVDGMPMDALTKLAAEMGHTARTIRMYGEGFGGKS